MDRIFQKLFLLAGKAKLLPNFNIKFRIAGMMLVHDMPHFFDGGIFGVCQKVL
jgi:hypothetical protein